MELLDIKETARRLNTSPEHVRGLVEDGRLRFVNIGRGAKRPRYRFTDIDVADFIESNRRLEEAPCQFSRSRGVRTTNSISSSVGVGFTAQRNARVAKRQKSSKL
ncbi:hypothetical protein C2U70_18975 [Bradyrhizobium guangdongense]|uniref:helix-turn-helix domain-containing protein n=1 Tax=Bradyrhizobium guangdongense TaxID=1325090 RepID=UPI001128ABD8|nr:hypothetical protein C2U70_18975 [Bradyrhizobium guangdongense]